MKTKPMLGRFSLYGFLKNQQYYDPFLILAFRQMGLTFFVIGLLIAFREIMVNILEIPSGAIADLYGRRKSMIFSFMGYIVSFTVFGISGLAMAEGAIQSSSLILFLFGAMVFFAIGDAFRTGTHKAMIFAWLRLEGQENQRTRVYGYTRSWSKLGSAVSVILAALFVFYTSNYILIFFFSIVPYSLGILNFLGYPGELDNASTKPKTTGAVFQHLRDTLRVSMKQSSLRRLILESIGFEGFFKASKDYLQPVLQSAAIPLTGLLLVGTELNNHQQAALLVGPVYFVLYLLSAVASRNAHKLVNRHGSEDNTAQFLWLIALVILVVLAPSLFFGWYPIIILGFVGLYIMQNLWRPVLISRFDAHSDATMGATVLSIESQAKSVATMVMAPGLGYLVDITRHRNIGVLPFWPVALFGAILALIYIVSGMGRGTGGAEINHDT